MTTPKRMQKKYETHTLWHVYLFCEPKYTPVSHVLELLHLDPIGRRSVQTIDSEQNLVLVQFTSVLHDIFCVSEIRSAIETSIISLNFILQIFFEINSQLRYARSDETKTMIQNQLNMDFTVISNNSCFIIQKLILVKYGTKYLNIFPFHLLTTFQNMFYFDYESKINADCFFVSSWRSRTMLPMTKGQVS